MVEVGQYIVAAAPQGAAELRQFLQGVGDTAAQRGDDRGHHGFAAVPVGVGVGGDQSLVEAPAQLDGEVVLVSEPEFGHLCWFRCWIEVPQVLFRSV